jgi:hypothetical protein
MIPKRTRSASASESSTAQVSADRRRDVAGIDPPAATGKQAHTVAALRWDETSNVKQGRYESNTWDTDHSLTTQAGNIFSMSPACSAVHDLVGLLGT